MIMSEEALWLEGEKASREQFSYSEVSKRDKLISNPKDWWGSGPISDTSIVYFVAIWIRVQRFKQI
jgi:hypothetical protein